MPSALVIPPAIDEVVDEFDSKKSSFNEFDVQQALNSARASIVDPTESESFGAWAELLAFGLIADQTGKSPWGTYYSPMGAATDGEGNALYFPDIAEADDQVIAHWASRARTLINPVLKARYADLAWEMCRVIAKTRPDPKMGLLAIDSYLASIETSFRPDLYDRFNSVVRAFDLASLMKNKERADFARKTMLDLHREAVNVKQGLWWIAFDRLIEKKYTGITDEEKQEIINDLEALVFLFSDTSNPRNFDPHALQGVAKRLILHYIRLQQRSDIQRLNATIARTFEHFAGLGDAMLASSALQTSLNAYRDAGMSEDSERVRVLMQEKIRQSADEMVSIVTEMEISRADMEAFLSSIVVDDLGDTFVNIAANFLTRKSQIEKQIKEAAEHAPLQSFLSTQLVVDDHVAGIIGPIESDSMGRLIHKAQLDLQFSQPFLDQAFRRTIEVHQVEPGHFVGWANRHDLFSDMSLLLEGIQAWYDGDLIKTLHVIIPQIETGLRGIVAQSGKPITKAHFSVAGASVAIGMGDILYCEPLRDILGPDLTLYLLAIYADPRGMNLRNRLAHGLIKPNQICEHLAQLLIHTLLVFGVWKELVESRRARLTI